MATFYLKAVGAIYRGDERIKPGDVFQTEDAQEADRLKVCGAAIVWIAHPPASIHIQTVDEAIAEVTAQKTVAGVRQLLQLGDTREPVVSAAKAKIKQLKKDGVVA